MITGLPVVRISASILLGVLATWIVFLNWWNLGRGLRGRGRPHSSIILIGGVVGSLALLISPGPLRSAWMVPFLLDYGSLPVIGRTLVVLAWRRLRS